MNVSTGAYRARTKNPVNSADDHFVNIYVTQREDDFTAITLVFIQTSESSDYPVVQTFHGSNKRSVVQNMKVWIAEKFGAIIGIEASELAKTLEDYIIG